MKRFAVPVTCLALAASASVLVVWRSHGAQATGRRPVRQIAVSGTPDTAEPKIEQLAAPRGVLAIKAEATVRPFDMQDRAVWWRLAVRPRNPLTGRFAAAEPADYRALAVQVPAGRSRKVEFAERLALEPGRYRVELSLVEGIRSLDGEGNEVQDHSRLAWNYRVLEVK